MIQLKAYNDATKSGHQYIDLYETDPIKLTFSIEDITSAEAKSIYSQTFRVPGTPTNNKYFKFAFVIGTTDFDVTIKKPAELLVDGAEFRQGHIRLQRVIRNEKKDRYDYEILFLGETRDFSSAIGSASMCELDLSNLSHTLTTANVTKSWEAYPSTKTYNGTTITPSFSNGLQLTDPDGATTYGDVIYPLVDFGNIYPLSNSNPRIATGESHDFTNHALPLNRLKPMVRARALVDAIFAQTDYSYEPGGFFDTDLFKQIYVSAWGNAASVTQTEGLSENIFTATGNGSGQPSNAIMECYNEVSDPGNNYNPSTYIYKVPIAGNYSFYAQCYFSASNVTTGDRPEGAAVLEYRVNGGAWNTIATGPFVNGSTSTVSGSQSFTTAQVTTGTGVEVRAFCEQIDYGYNINWSNLKFECTFAPGPVNVSAQFDCTYKQIDFIKDILTSFRLVMAPKKDNPTVFIIEPWVDYIASGDRFDWSPKLDRSQDVLLEPLFFTQTDEINFRHTEDKDFINQYHLDAYKDEYGYLLFDSANELLTGNKEIKTNWAPTPQSQLEGEANTSSFILPKIHVHDSENGEHQPIKSKTRFLFYNGLQDTDGVSWRLQNGTGYHTLTLYPFISNSSVWPMTNSGTVLNWFNDIGYWGSAVTGYPTQLGQSMYDTYWNGYIQSLYNKDARRLTGTFILNSVDLQDFSFDDIIFLDGHYYRPEKIIDAPIGEPNKVKVQLIKLLNYTPPINPEDIVDEPTDDDQVA